MKLILLYVALLFHTERHTAEVLAVNGIDKWVQREDCPRIIGRAEWGAKPSVGITTLPDRIASIVVVHHTNTPACYSIIQCKINLQAIQEDHMTAKDWDDIGYNFMIGSEGTTFEGRGWGLAGAPAKKWNSKSIEIALVGNLNDKNPTAAQLMVLEELIECGIKINAIAPNYRLIGHRQLQRTSCPGNQLFRILKNMPNFDPKPKY